MTRGLKGLAKFCKQSLSLVIAFSMMLSVCAISGVSLDAFAASTVTVYFKNTANWSPVYAYSWNGESEPLGKWAGTTMTKVEGSADIYKIGVTVQGNGNDHIIFNGGNSSQQTDDLSLTAETNRLYDFSTKSWSSNFDESQFGGNSNSGISVASATSNCDAVVPHNFPSNIFSVDATYFDYITDVERSNGYLNPIQAGTENFNGAQDNWYPFYIFNRAIRNTANQYSNWYKPLYLGNFCNAPGSYDTSGHSGPYNNAVYTENLTRFDYGVNNSNGITRMFQSYQGLVQNTLDASGNLMASSTLKMPYFDTNFLMKNYDNYGNVSSGGGRIAKVFKSHFPFRYTTDASTGITTYQFDSNNAKDNVYFTWNGNNPTSVNYGSGTSYGVRDGIDKFMYGGESGYGIFPFNNAWGYNGGNNNLDYGFGIRLDMQFRVPSYGTTNGTTTGTPITFDYSGDDDIWVYITDDTGKSELVLDLGGSHKKASGSINFHDMESIVSDSYAGLSGYYDKSVVPQSNEFWVQSSHANIKLHAWNGSSSATIQPVTSVNGYYVFKQEQLKNYTGCLFFYGDGGIGTGTKLSGDYSINSNWYGKLLNENGTIANYSPSTKVKAKKFNNGINLSPNKTYKLSVFFMERGLIESNFKVGFTFVPMKNLLTTEKIVETANVNSGLQDAVKNINSSFTMSNKYSTSSTGATSVLAYKDYVHTNAYGSTSQLKSDYYYGTYQLKSNESASFTDITKTGNWLTVSESDPNIGNLKYSTTCTVTDAENNTVVNTLNGNSISTDGRTAKFLFSNIKNTSTQEYLTNYNVKFVNTPNVSDLSVTKVEKNSSGTVNNSGEDFTFTILVDINGGTNYTAYPLQYTLNGATYTAYNGIFDLKGGQTATFKNIPVGASYKVVETANAKYTTTPSNRTYTGEVGSTGSDLTFTNTEIKKAPATVTMEFVKYLDGETPDTNEFEFTLTLLKKNGSELVPDKLLQRVHNNGKYVQFAPMTYDGSEHEPFVPPETEPTTEPTTEPLPPPLEGENVIYFDSGHWNVNNAWFAVYAWDGNGNETFVKMTKMSGNVYGADLGRAYPNVIFAQMYAGTTDVSWDNVSMQTADLTVPSGKDFFTVNPGENNGANGTWSTYPTSGGNENEPVTPPISGENVVYFDSGHWNVNNANFAVYAWDDSGKETFVMMNKISGNVYGADLGRAYPNVIFAQMYAGTTDASWDYVSMQTADLTVPSGKDLFTVNVGEKNGANGTWSTYTSTSSYNLIRSANSEPDEDIHYVDYAAIKASSVEKYYYLIQEKKLDNPAYTYDKRSYYAVVTVDRSVNPNTAELMYYTSDYNALNNYSPIKGTVKLAFNNYHNGSIEITKKSGDELITDSVKFSLYKTFRDGGELGTLVEEKTVDENGKVKFENLQLFSDQDYYGTTRQWYCFVETVAKDGYMIDNTKYYFTIPASQKLADQNSSVYDFQSYGVKYNYLRSDDNKLIYDIKVDVDNYAVVTPKTSGTGINFYLFLGLGIIGTGAMLAVAYTIYDKAQRKKRKARYTATHY